MPQNVSESPVWTTTVTSPQGGEARSSASVLDPVKDITDRTAYLRQQTNGAQSNTIVLPICDGVQNQNVGGVFQYRQSSGADFWQQSDVTGAAELMFPLHPGILPLGCTATGARIYLQGSIGAAHGGTVQFPPTLLFEEYDMTAFTRTYQVSQVDTTGGVPGPYDPLHFFDLTISRLAARTNTSKRYVLKVIGESGTNAAANKLAIVGVSLTWTAP